MERPEPQLRQLLKADLVPLPGAHIIKAGELGDEPLKETIPWAYRAGAQAATQLCQRPPYRSTSVVPTALSAATRSVSMGI